MMNEDEQNSKLKKLLESIELPDSAYESAQRRYKSLGTWLGRKESSLSSYAPRIFPQGSFALGTAIRPVLEREEYDLDLTCSLEEGVSRATHSQEMLKEMVGVELEQYRNANRVKEPLEKKHRCWRMHYSDDLRFHMDIVPAIPLEKEVAAQLEVVIASRGLPRVDASTISARALWITDDRSKDFDHVPGKWLKSNPEGYTEWFRQRLERSSLLKAEATVAPLPLYRRKAPLQHVIQLLKRHRDVMYEKHQDQKPISIIITTIAAQSAHPDAGIAQTLWDVLRGLQSFCATGSSVVLNPSNPEENFADRWSRPECAHLYLKENFHSWVSAATRDFSSLGSGVITEERARSLEKALKVPPLVASADRIREVPPRQVRVSEQAPRPHCK